jgi:hypothetical protein
MASIHERDSDRQRIARLTQNLIDLDTVVDDCRADMQAAQDRLRAAEHRRNVAAHLLYTALQTVARAPRHRDAVIECRSLRRAA